MTQLSRNIDRRMNELSVRIGELKKEIETLTEEYDARWLEVFENFDEFGAAGEGARFLASDGYVLVKQKSEGKAKLNAELLKQLIFAKYSQTKALRLWRAICNEVPDSTKIERMIQEKKLDASLVSECITETDPTFSRVRREWSKDDHNRAVVLGVVRDAVVTI